MGDDSGLTHNDLALATGVSVTTVKSYRSKFPDCFHVRSTGKPLRFAPEALETCRAIRQGFTDGLSVEELHERLRLRFPWSWRHPLPEKPALSANLEKTVQDMARGVIRMTQSLAAAERRLERLEQAGASTASTASSDDAGAVRNELLALRTELDALRSRIDATGHQPPPKIIRIRTPAGATERFSLQRLPDETDAAAQGAPPDAILDLPLTVLSPKNEYLGVAGPGGHLSVRGFLALLSRSLEIAPAAPLWSQEPDGWRLHLGADRSHILDFRETTTPRGNRVALVLGMRIRGVPQDADALIDLLRTLRKDYSDT